VSTTLPLLPPEEPRGGFRQLFRDLFALDRGALAILVAAPVLLTLLDYLGLPWHYTRGLERSGHVGVQMTETRARSPDIVAILGNPEMPGPEAVRPFLWWGLAVLVTMIVLPLLVARLGAGLRPSQIGLKLRGTLRDAPVYALLYALFLPVVWLVSRSPHFQQTYPFYKPAGAGPLGSDFLLFEAVYCLQFLGVELFFRGFLVLGLKRALGLSSVLVMLAPYCMIHYYKPMPEALGSIGAGLLLGLLAWRTGTIIYGWFLHYAVALSMDLLALHQTGRL
jgi:hypothetical protein